MRYHVLTLFPEMITQAASASILGRAAKNGHICVEATNIRDYAANKHMRVDDYPYGGGAGMVMEAEPVYRAYEAVKEKIGRKPRTIYLTPQGKVLSQTMVEEFAREEDLVLLCGHYEGIDERVLEEVVTDYVSIGDYVLTGGELGAMVMIDAISRFVPGVLTNEESSQFESLQDNLLEYPQYTRPEIWHEKAVPQVLLSGDHKKIEEWRYQQSLVRTQERRPDLLDKSYRIHCALYGTDPEKETAQELCGRVSRYGTLLDFNRKKLRKQKYTFEEKDLLLIVAGEAFLCDPGEPPAFSNLRGKHTPYILISTAAQENVPEMEKKIRAVMDQKGFQMQRTYTIGENGQEKIGDVALDIRKWMD